MASSPSARAPPLRLLPLLLCPLLVGARPLVLHPSVNVAVVFSGSSYQSEVRGRLSGENFADLPVAVNPVTVLVNDTNPRDLLTRLCNTMAAEKLHGVVFEDDVVAEVAQILDFLSTQTSLPIVGISGGSAVVIPYKEVTPTCLCGSLVFPTLIHSLILTCLVSTCSTKDAVIQIWSFPLWEEYTQGACADKGTKL
uniref:Uncharacterized protein n=1 Tax=Neogobius melanostomus TaxID=47308 RepID=A0A8C6TE37_9GOBI